MLKISLSEMQDSFKVEKWGWTQGMFLYFVVSGACSLVTVHQPPVLTTALGHDVTMQCQLSHNENMVTPPVLYWMYLTQNAGKTRLWIPSEEYEGRVALLDNDVNSSNKSIVLKNVQWADSGKYLCRLSIHTVNDRFRRTGNETLLMVHDNMIFNLTSRNDSLLRCEVNVTPDPGFVLSIFNDGCKLQTVDSAPGDAVTAQPYVKLSETVPLWSGGKYECRLHLNKHLITKSIFHHPPVAGECGDAEEKVSITVSEPGVAAFPEPWLLYVGLLLVPVSVLLGFVTALLYVQKLSLSTCSWNTEA